MKKQEFNIYNLYCRGETTLAINEQHQYLGKFVIQIENVFTATIIIDPDFLEFPNNHPHGTTKTGTMTIEVAKCNDITPSQISEDVCTLISFAINSLVFSQRENEVTSNAPNSLSKGGWRRIVKENNGEELRKFVECCWKNYNKFRDSRKLFTVIRLLVKINELRPHAYIDQSFYLTVGILENLKFTYAVSDNYPRKNNGQFAYKTNATEIIPFKTLIRKMVELVKIPRNFEVDFDILTTDRNQIIHEGVFDCDPKEMREKYEYMFSFIQVYLLALLEFNGQYYQYNENNDIKSFLTD